MDKMSKLTKRPVMKNILFILIVLLSYIPVSAQITKSDQLFSNITTFDGKVVFVKEIKLKDNNLEKSYLTLKEWGKFNFAKDPFNSSINYDDKNRKITARSRIELLLPENGKSIREKHIMKYRLDAFIKDNLCIVEITTISYINDAKANNNTLPQKIKAEDLITDKGISINDSNKDTRLNIRKNTVYFFNDLVNSLQNVLNY